MRRHRRIAFAALAALAGGAAIAASTGIAAQGDTPATEDVTVVLSEYRFSPERLALRQGVSYRLLLDNRGKEIHEFTAPEFFAAVVLATPDLVPGGREVVLPPGERKVLHFVARRAGRFPFFCADHDWAGMTGEIAIE